MSDVERPGRIRGDELHLYAPAATECRTGAAHARFENAAHERREGLFPDAEIDEPGTGDRDLGDRVRIGQTLHDALGDLARPAPRDSGERQRDGTREVAVGVAAAALDRNVR